MASELTVGIEHDRDRRLLAEPARQSPIAFVFIAGRFLRQLGLSGIAAAVVFVFNGGFAIATWALAFLVAVALLVFSALSWWRFTFAVIGDELLVTKGIWSVERLVIPLDRVQSVSIDQRLMHRIVGLVRAGVDTAGSSGVEFEIDAIDVERADALRRLASDARTAVTASAEDGRRPPAAVPSPPDAVVLRRSFAELVRVGATRVPWAGLALLAPLIALGGEFDRAFGLGDRLDQVVEQGEGVADDSAVIGIALLFGLVVLGTVLGVLLQVVGEILANWDLTLLRTSTGLRRTGGLLNTTSRSTTSRRVQMVTTDEAPLQRRLGFTTFTLRTFGETDFGLPGTKFDEIERVRRLVFGAVTRPDLDRTISRWSIFKATRDTAVLVLVITAALWFWIGWWSLLALLAVPAEWAAARRRWRLHRWGLNDDALAESYQFIARHTGEVPLFKAQMVTVRQSFFERRKDLATIRLATASGTLTVPMVDLAEAKATRDRIAQAVASDRRPAL